MTFPLRLKNIKNLQRTFNFFNGTPTWLWFNWIARFQQIRERILVLRSYVILLCNVQPLFILIGLYQQYRPVIQFSSSIAMNNIPLGIKNMLYSEMVKNSFCKRVDNPEIKSSRGKVRAIIILLWHFRCVFSRYTNETVCWYLGWHLSSCISTYTQATFCILITLRLICTTAYPERS